jgi:hypothetical protein
VDRTLVTYTGRLIQGKGLETLLAAARSLADIPSVHFVLVGSGSGQVISIEDALRAEAAADTALAGRVTFTGRVENVAAYLQASDVFAFPTLDEALGMSAVEAQACGLPAVASRTGGVPDIIEDGLTGVLVTPGDAGELASGLRRLLTDDALRDSVRPGRPRAHRRALRLWHDGDALRGALPRSDREEAGLMKVALTGASGYTGGHILRRLLARGDAVKALVREGSITPHLRASGAEIVPGVLGDPEAARRLVAGCDAVMHVAAVYRTAGHPDAYYRRINVEGTRMLLEAAVEAGARRFVHTSTVGVHGDVKNPPSGRRRAHRAERHLPGDEGRSGCDGPRVRPRAWARGRDRASRRHLRSR